MLPGEAMPVCSAAYQQLTSLLIRSTSHLDIYITSKNESQNFTTVGPIKYFWSNPWLNEDPQKNTADSTHIRIHKHKHTLIHTHFTHMTGQGGG